MEIDPRESGQGMVEYGLIIALVALAVVVALGFLSGRIQGLFFNAGNQLNNVNAHQTPAPY